jgi:hypothetical protein
MRQPQLSLVFDFYKAVAPMGHTAMIFNSYFELTLNNVSDRNINENTDVII